MSLVTRFFAFSVRPFGIWSNDDMKYMKRSSNCFAAIPPTRSLDGSGLVYAVDLGII